MNVLLNCCSSAFIQRTTVTTKLKRPKFVFMLSVYCVNQYRIRWWGGGGVLRTMKIVCVSQCFVLSSFANCTPLHTPHIPSINCWPTSLTVLLQLVTFFYFLFFYNCSVPWGFLPWKLWGCLPLGKPAVTESH